MSFVYHMLLTCGSASGSACGSVRGCACGCACGCVVLVLVVVCVCVCLWLWFCSWLFTHTHTHTVLSWHTVVPLPASLFSFLLYNAQLVTRPDGVIFLYGNN